MSLIELDSRRPRHELLVPDVEIVVPVHNEERQLAASVSRLRGFLSRSFPFEASITIVDNASTDGTWRVAGELARALPGVRAVRLDRKGRGLALRAAWTASEAPVVAYMDVDLATGLQALLPLVAPLLSGHSDLAIGTRLAPGAHVVRGAKRELISRAYNHLLHLALRGRFSDAQCGFKALRAEVARELLAEVRDDGWFFDTELLVLAQRRGLRIHEVPVDWVDDPDSRVDLVRTAWGDLRGVARLLRSGPSERRSGRAGATGGEPGADELLAFAGVGMASTVAYLVGFALLREPLGAFGANALAVTACSLANTGAHRRLAAPAAPTALVGRLERGRRWLTSASLAAVSLGVTSGALGVTVALGERGLWPELVAVTVANTLAALVRFALLRSWVLRPRPAESPPGARREAWAAGVAPIADAEEVGR